MWDTDHRAHRGPGSLWDFPRQQRLQLVLRVQLAAPKRHKRHGAAGHWGWWKRKNQNMSWDVKKSHAVWAANQSEIAKGPIFRDFSGVNGIEASVIGGTGCVSSTPGVSGRPVSRWNSTMQQLLMFYAAPSSFWWFLVSLGPWCRSSMPEPSADL